MAYSAPRLIERSWTEIRDKVRQQWDRLTEDDINRIEGRRDALLEKLKERYGMSYERIDRAVAEFEVDIAYAARGVTSPMGIGQDWA
jgi:uncharacterized protein YjbJ (UPF0337 family)